MDVSPEPRPKWPGRHRCSPYHASSGCRGCQPGADMAWPGGRERGLEGRDGRRAKALRIGNRGNALGPWAPGTCAHASAHRNCARRGIRRAQEEPPAEGPLAQIVAVGMGAWGDWGRWACLERPEGNWAEKEWLVGVRPAYRKETGEGRGCRPGGAGLPSRKDGTTQRGFCDNSIL